MGAATHDVGPWICTHCGSTGTLHDEASAAAGERICTACASHTIRRGEVVAECAGCSCEFAVSVWGEHLCGPCAALVPAADALGVDRTFSSLGGNVRGLIIGECLITDAMSDAGLPGWFIGLETDSDAGYIHVPSTADLPGVLANVTAEFVLLAISALAEPDAVR